MTSDIEQMSREVAERIGWRECAVVEGFWMPPGESDCAKGDHHCYAQQPPDLTDARDREAVIEWLVAKGWTVTLSYKLGNVRAVIYRPEVADWFPMNAPTIAEALGRAFLAATKKEDDDGLDPAPRS